MVDWMSKFASVLNRAEEYKGEVAPAISIFIPARCTRFPFEGSVRPFNDEYRI